MRGLVSGRGWHLLPGTHRRRAGGSDVKLEAEFGGGHLFILISAQFLTLIQRAEHTLHTHTPGPWAKAPAVCGAESPVSGRKPPAREQVFSSTHLLKYYLLSFSIYMRHFLLVENLEDTETQKKECLSYSPPRKKL